MKTIQLELKNVFFSLETIENSKCQVLESNGVKVSIRNGTDEFLKELAKHFKIAVWSRFKPEIHSHLTDYIQELGIYLQYSKDYRDCSFYGSQIKKSIRRLNHLGFPITDIIELESTQPIKRDYNNVFLVTEFKGQEDKELESKLQELIDLANAQDTTRINN